jgi:hypothetical protein
LRLEILEGLRLTLDRLRCRIGSLVRLLLASVPSLMSLIARSTRSSAVSFTSGTTTGGVPPLVSRLYPVTTGAGADVPEAIRAAEAMAKLAACSMAVTWRLALFSAAVAVSA